jgi:type II secretory pathway component PulF
MSQDSPASFAYEAQTEAGDALSGTIDAPDAARAATLLESLRLRVLRIDRVNVAARAAPLRGDDFTSFNQQLAHLTAAGLPVEHGLRLIAQDMRSGRLAETIRTVAAELERGTPMGEAFDRHRENFPALYGRLVEAGVRSGNLSGMLLNLGRHLEMVNRLRGMMWRATAYPLMVLVVLLVVLLFISGWIIPQFEELFADFGVRLPQVTQVLLGTSGWLPPLLTGILVAIALVMLLWPILRLSGRDQVVVEAVVLPTPLVGPVLRRNMIARWCDALRLGVDAGLDLPRAIGLANEAIGSRALRRDGQTLITTLEQGRPLDESSLRLRIIPATVSATIELGRGKEQLSESLAALAELYQQQAEVRLNLIPAILTPLMLIFTAAIIGLVVLGLFAPLIVLIQAVSGA